MISDQTCYVYFRELLGKKVCIIHVCMRFRFKLRLQSILSYNTIYENQLQCTYIEYYMPRLQQGCSLNKATCTIIMTTLVSQLKQT